MPIGGFVRVRGNERLSAPAQKQQFIKSSQENLLKKSYLGLAVRSGCLMAGEAVDLSTVVQGEIPVEGARVND